ncbi:hypothetical protein ABIB06_002206 [Bradyrhizobium sp. LB8.2]|uniref:LPD7 domain-containing protein n=1 Tax=unclassified Bradyrhizobium TaxID=2631580 RepID=UPI003395B1A6
MDGNMNNTRENSQDFSFKRRERTGHDPGTDNTAKESAAKSASAENASSAAMGDNALPDRIRRKYYVAVNEPGKEGANGGARLYADDKGEYLAFKVADDRLVTRHAAAEVIRDMVSVAQHRQWTSLEVRGSVEFRREAWLEASARGMQVRGYQPTELDRQTLADRQDVWKRTQPRSLETGPSPVSDKDGRAERLDYDKGVSGRLIEVGQAPYRNQNDAEKTAYVAIELDSGRRHQVWGVGLEKATADSDAKPGDRVQVRRDGVEQVTKTIKVIDAANGQAHVERRQVLRNRWRVTAETFRSADRQTAARDPALVTAQSQMAIIERALERAFPDNERARQKLAGVARERISQHLEHGHLFARANVMESMQTRSRSGNDKDDIRRDPNSERIRTQGQER